MITIHSSFDAGNIEVLACDRPDDIRLQIRRDAGDRHGQWFFFQLCNAAAEDCRMVIGNAGEMSYPEGFRDYRAVASYDQEHWFRIDTEFDGNALTLHHRPEHSSVYYAYFAPYSLARHQDLVSQALSHPDVTGEVLCTTPDGQPHTLLTIGHPGPGRRKIWVTSRQHPGETMAEWWVEGFLERLLDPEDPVGRGLLEKAVVYLVPNMCLDGSVRGHLRCNARGANLNRAWKDPSKEDSPEVYHVRARMHETGVDLALDVHGDEALPYNFIAGPEGVPSWNEQRNRELVAFKKLLARITPDFQVEHGYEIDPPNSSDLRKCTDYMAEAFGCLAMTLEMPFKDTADTPVPEIGWSPGRSQKLGGACLDAMYRHLVDENASHD